MGFELYIDEEPRWAGLGLAIARALDQLPRIRFYVAGLASDAALPPGLAHRGTTGDFRERREYFWARSWHCQTCNLRAVPHSQRLLHSSKGHEISAGPIVKKGFHPPWRPQAAVVVAPAERLKARRGVTIAVTAAPIEPIQVSTMYGVLLLPLLKLDHQAAATRILDSRPPTLEHVIVGEPGVDAAVRRIVELLTPVDEELFAPADPEAAELKDQELRARSVGPAWRNGVPGTSLPPGLAMKMNQMTGKR